MSSQLRIPLLFLCFALGSAAITAKEDSFPGIENLMTKQEYVDAGLEKLSPVERDALNQWLVRYTANEAPHIRATDPEVQEVERETTISARLIKDFSGWNGKTHFYLDNGQVWQQRLGGTYHYAGEPPEVVFKKNFIGYWNMTLVSNGRGIGVKRIK